MRATFFTPRSIPYKSTAIVLWLLLIGQITAFGQISIDGPACVTAGTQYSYTISGSWTTSMNMDWVVAGGTISGSSNGTPLPQIHVTFTSSGFVKVSTTNPTSSFTLNVMVAGPVSIGATSPSSQTIDYQHALSIAGGNPSGGVCGVVYAYKWQQSFDGSTWSDVSGATSLNLSLSTGPAQLTYFKEKLTDTVGGSVAYSNVDTVNVIPPMSGGDVGPSTQNILIGSSTSAATLSGSRASGGNCDNNFNYTWQVSADGSNFTNIASGESYQPASAPGFSYYRRQATCSLNGQFVYSNVVTVDIESALAAGNINPSNVTVPPGTSPGPISSGQSTGGFCRGSYIYQWEQSTDAVHWVHVSGATGLSFTPAPIAINTYFRLLTTCGADTVTGPTCIAHAQVEPGVAGPSAQQINYGQNAATLSIGPASGGSGTYVYQWQSSPDSTFTNATSVGTDSLSYTPLGDTVTTWYRVMVSSFGSADAFSAKMVVNAYSRLFAGAISPSGQSIYYGSRPAQLSVVGTMGGSGSWLYQWFSYSNGSFQSLGPPSSISTYQPGILTSTTIYEVVVSSNGVNQTLGPDTVSVGPLLLAGLISPPFIAIPPGANAGTITSGPATCRGCSAGFGYNWQSSVDSVNWSNVGDTTRKYSPGALSATRFYRMKVNSGTLTAYSAIAEVRIGVQNDSVNLIRTRSIAKPGVMDLASAAALTDPVDVQQVTQYFDGLGRPIQTVARQASPQLKDMVAVQAYDRAGREALKYLPFTSDSSDGNYKAYPYPEQQSFNASQFPGENYFYGQVNFEASPLNRPLATYAAGNSWIGAGKGVSQQYLLNDSPDSVHMWDIGFDSAALPADQGYYAPGTLRKNVTVDEQNHQVVEYKDKDGNIVLKKVQLTDSPGLAHSGWLCTYYVYDDLNNLRFVLPPRAVELINNAGTWAVSQPIADELCFRYEYDSRKRMMVKKVPGAGETGMAYDVRDRLVMTQDANLRAGSQWLVTQYDGLNRPVETGLITDAVSLSAMQQLVTNQTNGSNTAPSILVDTTVTGANTTGDIQATNSITLDVGFSTPDGGTFTAEIGNGSWGGGGSTTNSDPVSLSPVPPGVALHPLTLTYYDDYSWVTGTQTVLSPVFASNVATNAAYFITGYNAAPVYAVPITPYAITKGQVTGTQTLVLGTDNQYLSTVHFYDDRARLIQAQSINYTGGIDTLTTQYDFSGKPLRTLLAQGKPTNGAQSHRVLTKTSYDAGFRVTSTWKNIDDAAAGQLIDSMQYNELAQLRTKYLGNNVESLVYDYNIRGWVTGINKDFVKGTVPHYFGMELGYDNAVSVAGTNYATPAFNGNISGTVWKSAGDGVRRKYDFSYDNVNRLTGAVYLDNHSGSGWDSSAMSYTVSGLRYDANGNIMSMNQNGFRIGNPTAPIDKLTYSYQTNSNKLSQVVDGANDTASVLGDFHYKQKQDSDYRYDANGNLSLDNNKSIDSIAYNYLNLPQRVHMKGKGNILYIYDATGNKLQKQTVDSLAELATTTLYLGGFQYQRRTPLNNLSGGTDTLQFAGHEEGRVRWAYHKYTTGDPAYGWEYDFMERDHLGNTRVLLTQERDTAHYIATMEKAYRNTENALFYGIDSSCIPRTSAPGYPNDLNYSSPNDSVIRLNGNGPKIGPSIVLKVMSGDSVDLGVQYYYRSSGSGSGNNLSAQDLLSSLASGLSSLSPVAHAGFSSLSNPSSSPLIPLLNSSLANDTGTAANKPQAYLNWMLLDNQFNYVAGGNQSGALQVGAPDLLSNGQLQLPLVYRKLPIGKSGYLYIYVSNATKGWDVFFDNLSITHYRGPLLEENHYYPFGLTMAGISDKALKGNYAENKYRYNKGSELQSKEFSDGSGLEIYEAPLRSLDPQLGRWWQIDSKPTEAESPYASMGNNPILRNDPLGDTLDFPGASDKFVSQFFAAVNYLDAHGVGDNLYELMIDPTHVSVYEQTDENGDDMSSSDKPIIIWSPTNGLIVDNAVLSPATNLDHEADHQLQRIRHPDQYKKDRLTPDADYDNKEEKRVTAGREQKTALALGEIKKGQVTRKNHQGVNVTTHGPTSNKYDKINKADEKQLIDKIKKQLEEKRNLPVHPGGAGPANKRSPQDKQE